MANGGFGPGYGIFGLEGGYAEDTQGLTTVEFYRQCSNDRAWAAELGEPWPRRMVPICEWGCQHLSAILCDTPEAEIIDLIEGVEMKRRGMTFARWMEDWVNGVELWPWEEEEEEEDEEADDE